MPRQPSDTHAPATTAAMGMRLRRTCFTPGQNRTPTLRVGTALNLSPRIALPLESWVTLGWVTSQRGPGVVRLPGPLCKLRRRCSAQRHLRDEQVVAAGPLHVGVEDGHLAVGAGVPPGEVVVTRIQRVVMAQQALVRAIRPDQADPPVKEQQVLPRRPPIRPADIGPLRIIVRLDPVARVIRVVPPTVI